MCAFEFRERKSRKCVLSMRITEKILFTLNRCISNCLTPTLIGWWCCFSQRFRLFTWFFCRLWFHVWPESHLLNHTWVFFWKSAEVSSNLLKSFFTSFQSSCSFSSCTAFFRSGKAFYKHSQNHCTFLYLDPLFHYLFSRKQIKSKLKFQSNSKI